MSYGPREYIGVDIEHGKNVDVICKAEDLLNMYKEFIENERYNEKILNNMLMIFFAYKAVHKSKQSVPCQSR